MKLSVIIPCLNEEKTVGICVAKAMQSIRNIGISGEVLVADNGSTDRSIKIAERHGARVVHAKEKGYGSALRAGIAEAKGEYIVMGDADDSYDFSSISPFYEKLEEGFDLVVGNRFSGNIAPGAMSFMKKYVGNPVLSGMGKLLYGNVCGDFHCGLRSGKSSALLSLNLKSSGMEFASEMIIKAVRKKLKIAEVPITLHPDGRGRPSHLRPFRDGLRHVKILLAGKFTRD